MVDEEVVLKNPSEAVEEVETLAEEFYNKTLILEKGNISLLVLQIDLLCLYYVVCRCVNFLISKNFTETIKPASHLLL